MKIRGLRLLAVGFFSLGIWSILAYASVSFAGAVVSENGGNSVISITGLIFLVIGIIVLSLSEIDSYNTSRLHQLVGERRYRALSEGDQTRYGKAIKRHDKLEDKRSYHSRHKRKSLDS